MARTPSSPFASSVARRRVPAAGALLGAFVIGPASVHGQARPGAPGRGPVVVVLPFTLTGDSALTDTTAIAQGIAALLEAELAAHRRVRATSVRPGSDSDVVAATRARGAAYAVLGDVAWVGDSVRVTARVTPRRSRWTS